MGGNKCCKYIWKRFVDKETHSKYTGDVKNAKPNGFGILFLQMGFGKKVNGKMVKSIVKGHILSQIEVCMKKNIKVIGS